METSRAYLQVAEAGRMELSLGLIQAGSHKAESPGHHLGLVNLGLTGKRKISFLAL